MTKEDLETCLRALLVSFVTSELTAFKQAWQRHLSELPFPIRIEGKRFFYRIHTGAWDEDGEYSAALLGGQPQN